MKVSKIIEAIKDELKKPLPPPRIMTKKEKRKMAKKKVKSENGEDVKVSKKKTKAEKPAKKAKESDGDDGFLTIADLATEANITAQSARVKLREAEVERPDGGRWRWKDGSKALKEVRKVLGIN